MTDASPLVSTDWLAAHLTAPDVRIVDASWHLPGQGRDAKAEFADGHIPGAVFFDIDDLSDRDSPYPNMLPDPVRFSSRVRKLGLGDGNRIVVYDSVGLFSAPRAWWMFKAMGYRDAAVLDGGLPKWRKEERPLSDSPLTPIDRHFTPRLNRLILRTCDQVKAAQSSGREQVVDTRSPERFAGSTPEPRPDIRAGHIPGSKNLHYKELLAADGTLLPAPALKEKVLKAGIRLDRPVVCTCGSGVSAAILFLALETLGHTQVSLYDGSWAEWGSRSDLEVETGT